jgi:hypothetical protein
VWEREGERRERDGVDVYFDVDLLPSFLPSYKTITPTTHQ